MNEEPEMETMNQPGWYPDPTDGSVLRWWDGRAWTDHTDTGAGTGGAPGSQVAASAGANGIGPAIRAVGHQHRPRAQVRDGILGIGGALVAIGAVALIAGTEPSSGAVGMTAAVLIAAAYAAIHRLPQLDWRPAGLGVLVVAIPSLAAALVVSDASQSNVTTALVLSAVGFGVAFLAPGTSGSPLMLGASLTALWATALASNSSTGSLGDSYSTYGYDYGYGYHSGWSWVTDPWGTVRDILQSTGSITLVAALVAIGGAIWLSGRGFHVLATPLLALSAAWTIIGGLATLFGDSPATVVLGIPVAIGLIHLGGRHGRRASLWWGCAIAFAAVIGLGVKLATGDDHAGGAMLLVIAGAGLVVAAPVVAGKVGVPERRPTAL